MTANTLATPTDNGNPRPTWTTKPPTHPHTNPPSIWKKKETPQDIPPHQPAPATNTPATPTHSLGLGVLILTRK
ncbi:MAG: hypothetical protein CME32_16240 [Gimesia sp.]|nr:hypothetical protein [Gimesia sp.]